MTLCWGSSPRGREDTAPDIWVRKETAVFIFSREKKNIWKIFFFKLFRLKGI